MTEREQRHIISCEYPPQTGGVSDYTHLLASHLAAAGEDIHVWAPIGDFHPSTTFAVHREFGSFGSSDLRRVGQQLDCFPAPRKLLVQWVPHGYGYRSLNIGFCRWLHGRAKWGDNIEIMIHEPFLGFSIRSPKRSAAAAIHRLMTMILSRSANRIWISIPAWERLLRPYVPDRISMEWLPVPSGIPVVKDAGAVDALRGCLAPGGELLIGHLGTYGIGIQNLVREAMARILREVPNVRAILLGKHSNSFARDFAADFPELASRINGTGVLPAADLSLHLSACDLMIQPYPDGVSTRRTSVMAGMCHGRAVVTTVGRLSEPLWQQTRLLALAPSNRPNELATIAIYLLASQTKREHLAAAGANLYRDRFDWPIHLQRLRRDYL